MKLRYLVALLGLALCGTAAQAQIGLYINPVVNRVSNSETDSGTFAFLGNNQKSAWFKGLTFGGYATLYKQNKIEAGVDVRGVLLRNQNAPLSSFLLGVRGSKFLDSLGSRGYAEVLGGVGKSSAPTNPKSVTRAQLLVVAGLDHPIGKYVDWRVIEAGYGTVGTINTSVATGNGTADYPSSMTLSLSTGLVFRF